MLRNQDIVSSIVLCETKYHVLGIMCFNVLRLYRKRISEVVNKLLEVPDWAVAVDFK